MSKQDWGTPAWVFDPLDDLYHFSLDAAATEENAKCARWFGPGGEREDALAEEWPAHERIWCNPPYQHGYQGKFALQALLAAEKGSLTVMLLPADTSTRLYHELIKWQRHEFLPRRVAFEGAGSGAKFPSMLVYFSPTLW